MSVARPLPWRTFGMFAALLVIVAVFTVATGGTFVSARNLSLLARQMSITALLASGMVLVIVAGQIDLSVGALAGFAGAISAIAITQWGLPLPAAVALALALGGLLGALQGALVARLAIPPFIVTLGGMLVFQGALLGVTRGVTVTPPPGYLVVGQSYVPPAAGLALALAFGAWFAWRAWRNVGASRVREAAIAVLAPLFALLMNGYSGIPVPVLLLLAVTGALSVTATRTPFGRHLYAIGGNREAAFYSGVPIAARITGVFALMGVLSGLAGVVLTARLGAATPQAGRMMELDAIAAAVIGGTSLLGGRGSVWGALLGALVMASLDNGMSLMDTEAFWQPILKGSILVLAVAADLAARRRD